jgi:anti-anti-sigma factor
VFKRITDKIRNSWADAAPPSSARPRRNPFARIEGRLNLRNAPALRRELWRLLWQRNRVIALECSAVRALDIGALAVLIEFAQECRDTGVHLRLVEPSEQMATAFSLYALDDVLVTLAEYIELDGTLIVMEEDFPDSIRLTPVVAAQPGIPTSQAVVPTEAEEPTLIEEEDFPESIRLLAVQYGP